MKSMVLNSFVKNVEKDTNMNDVRVYFQKLRDEAVVPEYKTVGSAGADLCSCVDVTILPGEVEIIPCGFAMAIADGLEAQIRPRSGLAIKNKITVINSPGTIDSDYRGEVMVGLINLGQNTYNVKVGYRVAQMIIAPVYRGHWIESADLEATARGTGGFGSTGR